MAARHGDGDGRILEPKHPDQDIDVQIKTKSFIKYVVCLALVFILLCWSGGEKEVRLLLPPIT
jgi:hypothetical protein